MSKLYAIPEEILTGIADAIRTKTGSDEQMPVPAFASAIEGISGGVAPYHSEIVTVPSDLIGGGYVGFDVQLAQGFSIAVMNNKNYGGRNYEIMRCIKLFNVGTTATYSGGINYVNAFAGTNGAGITVPALTPTGKASLRLAAGSGLNIYAGTYQIDFYNFN